jgi:class 3 adenylate cyclase
LADEFLLARVSPAVQLIWSRLAATETAGAPPTLAGLALATCDQLETAAADSSPRGHDAVVDALRAEFSAANAELKSVGLKHADLRAMAGKGATAHRFKRLAAATWLDAAVGKTIGVLDLPRLLDFVLEEAGLPRVQERAFGQPSAPRPEPLEAPPAPEPEPVSRFGEGMKKLAIGLAAGKDGRATLVDALRELVPDATSGGVLELSQQGELVLSAHWPEGRPLLSRTLARQSHEAAKPITGHVSAGTDPLRSCYCPVTWRGSSLGVLWYTAPGTTATAEQGLEGLTSLAAIVAPLLAVGSLEGELVEHRRIRSELLRHFSPKIAARLEGRHTFARLGGDFSQSATVLFADVRGFTAASHGLDPDHVLGALNELFEKVVGIVFARGGTIDKYIGDALLALFGVPEPDPHQELNAVLAGLEMQEAVEKANLSWSPSEAKPVRLGVGVTVGPLVQGFIGTQEKLEYTVIGDPVNMAARYCDAARPGEVLISAEVFRRAYSEIEAGEPRVLTTKHPDTEPQLLAYPVLGRRRGTIGMDLDPSESIG